VPAHYGIRTERYKLIFYYGHPLDAKGALQDPTAPGWELFDLAKDPYELTNEYSNPEYALIAKQLMEEMYRLKQQVGDID
jgi:arylsulfatase A-like enzyme